MNLSSLLSNITSKDSLIINGQDINFNKDKVVYTKEFWDKKTGRYRTKKIKGYIKSFSEVDGEVIFQSEKGNKFSIKINTLENSNIQKERNIQNDKHINISGQRIRLGTDKVNYTKNTWNKKTGRYEQKTISGVIVGPSEGFGEVIFQPEKGTKFSIKISTLENSNLKKNSDLEKTSSIKKSYLYYGKVAQALLLGIFLNKSVGSSTLSDSHQKEIINILKQNRYIVNDTISYNHKIKDFIINELQKFNSPITCDMVIDAARKHNIDVNLLMSFMRNDSHYGTKGIAVETKNPGNVGNRDNQKKHFCNSREDGVDRCAAFLKKLSLIYTEKFNQNPSAEELASGISNDGISFYWGYMTLEEGPKTVQKISDKLQKQGINGIPI